MLMNGLSPLPVRIFNIKHCHIGSVGADILHRQIIKFENILNKLIFRRLYGSLFQAFIHHHQDVFLGNVRRVFIRIDADQTKNGIGGCGKKKNKRRCQYGNKDKNRSNIQSNGLGMHLCKPLRNKFSENNTNVG